MVAKYRIIKKHDYGPKYYIEERNDKGFWSTLYLLSQYDWVTPSESYPTFEQAELALDRYRKSKDRREKEKQIPMEIIKEYKS